MAKHGRHSRSFNDGSYGQYSRNGGGYGNRYADGYEVKRGGVPRHSREFATGSLGKPYAPPAATASARVGVGAGAGAGQYSRDNYGSGAAGRRGSHATATRSRGELGTAKKVGIAIAAVVVVALAAVLVYLVLLNNALAPSHDERAKIDEQLVSAPLDQPFYMLLLGSDARAWTGESSDSADAVSNGLTDVMILARVDSQNHQITLVSIPRDTPYTADDGSIAKINSAYNTGGASSAIKAISQLTGEDIAHYAVVHLTELSSMVDALGGVEVYVDRELTVIDALTEETIVLEPGEQVLNGQQALAFVRARHEYNLPGENQDVNRQGNVRSFVQAIVEKVLDRSIVELPGVILELANYVETDLSSGDLITLGSLFMGQDLTMYSCSGPTEGYSADVLGGSWVCYPNPEGWAELMRQVDAGIEPGDIDFESTQTTL